MHVKLNVHSVFVLEQPCSLSSTFRMFLANCARGSDVSGARSQLVGCLVPWCNHYSVCVCQCHSIVGQWKGIQTAQFWDWLGGMERHIWEVYNGMGILAKYAVLVTAPPHNPPPQWNSTRREVQHCMGTLVK